jgi:hypothetical protein
MKSVVRLVASLVGGGVFYTVWLAVALSGGRIGQPEIAAELTILAPIITSLGFAVGLALAELLTGRRGGFFGAWLWALVGCAMGALVVYPFGPMLIVFGMFVLGTVAVAVREIRLIRRPAPAN